MSEDCDEDEDEDYNDEYDIGDLGSNGDSEDELD